MMTSRTDLAGGSDCAEWQALVALHAAALETMSHALCAYDADLRIALLNQRFLDMFGLSAAVAKPGVTMRALLQHSAERGNIPLDRFEEFWATRQQKLFAREPFRELQSLRDGRHIVMNYRPTAEGGWVCVYEDITAQHRLEQELRQQVARFNQAIGSMSHGLSMFDADERLIVCNEKYIEMYRLDPAVIKPGIMFRDLIAHWLACGNGPGETLDSLYAKRKAAVQNGEHTVQIHTLGDGRIVKMTSSPTPDGGWVVAHEDVTIHLRNECALREQNVLFDAALKNMAQGLCMYDKDQRLIVCNDKYVRLFNADPNVIKPGISLREVFEHGVARGTYPGQTADELLVRRLQGIAEKEVSTYDQKMADGRTLAVTICRMEGGGWVGTFEDVTERRRIEAERIAALTELSRQNMRFDAALKNMAQGLCMFDKDQRLIVCNDKYVRLFNADPDVMRTGVSLREVFEHGVSLGVHPEGSVDKMIARRLELIAKREPTRHDLHLPDGRTVAVVVCPMPDGGWVGTFEDVTERRRAETERAAALAELSRQNKLFDAALENMAQGLCMFDKDRRLIVINDKCIRLFGADPKVVRPGIGMREMLQHCIDNGVYAGDADAMLAHRPEALATGDITTYDQPLLDGRILAITLCPLSDGGWVSTYEDVTERRRIEAERAAALVELRERNMLFDAALDNMAQGLCVYDSEFRVVVHNRRYSEIYGLDKDIPPGTPMLDLIRASFARGVHVSGTSPEKIFADYKRRLIENGEDVLMRQLADGRIIAVRNRPLANGGWVGTYEDVTEREQAAERLREQNRRFDIAINNMAHGLTMLDADLRLIVCNRRYIEMYGLSSEIVKPGISMREIMVHSCAIGNHPGTTAEALYRNYVETLRSGETIIHRHLTDGRIIKLTHRPMKEGGWVVIYEDVTERHKAEQSIAHMARHDALTDLPNRVLFRESMTDCLARVEKEGAPLAVFCLDLNNFKTINDTLGHPIGDAMLRVFAARLTAAVGDQGIVARLGGDEFAILQQPATQEAAEMLAAYIVDIIAEPFLIEDHEINTGVSIGIAMAPRDGDTPDHLMKCADLALYRAKAEGHGAYRFFERDMDARLQQRHSLELDLRRALAAGEFALVYQPQINLETDMLTGFEALLRWNHPERGPVSPAAFIPIAEETGLILPIGEWVLREACLEAARWPDPIRVAVNLSAVQLRSRALLGTIANALAGAHLAPHRLEVEITETVMMQNSETMIARLHRLRDLGVSISMDDFGTGYSSLGYLRSFPFHKIKIDRAFISDLACNADSAAIVRAIAGLGASLGIQTTAEGIETPEQLKLVREAGCTEVQGFLFSRPQPSAEIGALIAKFRRDSAAA